MTNGTWSYKIERNIGFGLLSVACTIGDRIHIVRSGEVVEGTVTDLPFTRSESP